MIYVVIIVAVAAFVLGVAFSGDIKAAEADVVAEEKKAVADVKVVKSRVIGAVKTDVQKVEKKF